MKPCPTDKSLPDKPVLPEDHIPDKEIDVFHGYLYAQAWQSNSEDYVTKPNPPFQAEPTVTILETPEEQITQKDALTPNPGEPFLTLNPDEHPNDTTPRVCSDIPKNEIPPPNSPRKNKYNLRANTPSNWKKDYAYYNPINVDPILLT